MIRVLVEQLAPGMVIARTLLNERGDILLSRGTKLTSALIQLLKSRGYSQLDVNYADQPIVECEIISNQVRSVLQRHVSRLFEFGERAGSDPKTWRNIDMNQLMADVEAIVDSVMTRDSVDGLLSLKSHDDFTFSHSVDVAVVSVLLGKRIGLERTALFDLALGGLLHDIGKLEIPREILNKPEPLTESEGDIVRRHASIGYDILDRVPNMPLAPKIITRGHHERQDGKGYPDGRIGNNKIWRTDGEDVDGIHIHLYAEIVGVAEVYASLGSDWAYRKAMSQDEVLQTMVDMAGTQLNREIICRLLGMVATFPLGTEVVIRGSAYAGYRGVVTSVPDDSPSLPVVRLTHGANYLPLGEHIDVSTAELGLVEVAAYVPPLTFSQRAAGAPVLVR